MHAKLRNNLAVLLLDITFAFLLVSRDRWKLAWRTGDTAPVTPTTASAHLATCMDTTQVTESKRSSPFVLGATTATAGRYHPGCCWHLGWLPGLWLDVTAKKWLRLLGNQHCNALGNITATIPLWLCLPGDTQEKEIIFTKLRTESCLDKLCLGFWCRTEVSLI